MRISRRTRSGPGSSQGDVVAACRPLGGNVAIGRCPTGPASLITSVERFVERTRVHRGSQGCAWRQWICDVIAGYAVSHDESEREFQLDLELNDVSGPQVRVARAPEGHARWRPPVHHVPALDGLGRQRQTVRKA